MAHDSHTVQHRIATVQGQLGALSRMLADGDTSAYRCARMVLLVDGGWSGIRRAVVREWLERALEAVPEEERQTIEDLADGLQRVSGRSA